MIPGIKNIGVSPAFLISSYGTDFTPENVCDAIEKTRLWGFSNIQLEIFDQEKIPMWLEGGGAEKVKKMLINTGIIINQLVCHLLINEFDSEETLLKTNGFQIMKEVIQIGNRLECCDSIVLPVGSFNNTKECLTGQTSIETLTTLFIKKFMKFYDLIHFNHYKLAVELLPNTLIGSYKSLYDIIFALNLGKTGYLFDTGHAWAGGENVLDIPITYKGMIFGTHLCDNFGFESLSLSPGKGNINWNEIIKNLVFSKYNGYFDIEIMCEPKDVEEEYRTSLDFIQSLINRYGSNVS